MPSSLTHSPTPMPGPAQLWLRWWQTGGPQELAWPMAAFVSASKDIRSVPPRDAELRPGGGEVNERKGEEFSALVVSKDH